MGKATRKVPSIKLNMILNAIRGLMGVLFPLITYPYIFSIFGVDTLGKYNFANSISTYILLISNLGITTYAIREGAQIRDDKTKIEQFVNQMFTINVLSSCFSYLILFILLVFVDKFHAYYSIILILSGQVVFRTIGIEWIYSIYEDYLYITIRSVIFQIVSLVLMFLLVHNANDVEVYAGITVISFGGSNVLNFIHAKKYCRLNITKNIEIKKHLGPILILFAMIVTVTIYVSSDITMLGFLCDDHTVGLYSLSSKVYTIIKTILSSVLVVAIPRLSAYLGKGDIDNFKKSALDIYTTLLSVVIPSIVGLIFLREEIVMLLSTPDFLDASSSLSLLGIALFFCLGAWYWGQCILVPNKEEKYLFYVTMISAVVNVALNFALIPLWQENAAAVTTILAEAITFLLCWYKGRKIVKMKGIISTMFKVLLGSCMIPILGRFLRLIITNTVVYIVVFIITAVLLYFLIEIAIKNQFATDIIEAVTNKIKKNK